MGKSLPIVQFWKYPENGFLWETSQIVNQADDLSPEVLAELFVRLYLYNDKEVRTAIDGILRDGEAEFFCDRLNPEFRFRCNDLEGYDFWPSQCSDFSRMCQEAVRLRMQSLFSADGMIPVYSEEEDSRGYLIPFTLKPVEDAGGGHVWDLSGNEIVEWSNLLQEMKLPYDMVVHYHAVKGMPALCGRSVMLPIRMAIWRRENLLPMYSPFTVLATGDFNVQGKLSAVGMKKKLEAIRKGIAHHIFFFPQPIDEKVKPSTHDVPLALGTDVDSVREKIASYLEEHLSDGKFLLGYLLARFTGMEAEVRDTCYADWGTLVARLENLVPGISCGQHPEEYLHYNMILSEAYCHSGRTQDAKELNQRLRRFAERRGEKFRYDCLRLQIEELVLTIDSEGFGRIRELWKPLEEEIQKLNNTDLLMRFYGTMGQIHAYGSLAGEPGFTKEEALYCLQQARDYAADTGNPREESQDLNYLCLWHALFGKEETLEDQMTFREACGILECLDSSERPRTEQYLMRSLALANYRHLLLTGQVVHSKANGLRELLAGDRTFWVGALVHKYIGALEAAEGKTDRARKHFEKALMLLPEAACSGVLAVLRLTILAEAYRSMGDDLLRRAALDFAEGNDFLKNTPSAQKFIAYLRGERAEFPGLEYWY